MDQIIEEIVAERHRQDAQWGGAYHDDAHTQSEWYDLKLNYLVKSELFTDKPSRRSVLIKLAALTPAELQSIDRQTRKVS